MYATDDDVWQPVEIGGLISASRNLKAWMYEFPSCFQNVSITTKKCLVNTNRSKSTYKNEMKGNTVFFCLDKFENAQNRYLKEQVKLKSELKARIRVAEIPASGSTSVIDHGDFHVVDLWYKHNNLYGVELKRLKVQTHLPSGETYAHYTEKIAFDALYTIFPSSEYQVRKESLIINFAGRAQMINGKGIHCYNVDGKIRKIGTSKNIGIEIKQDWDAYLRNKEENLLKFKEYEDELGAPCLLLIVEPQLRIGKVNKASTVETLSTDIRQFVDAMMDQIF
jgi:YHS domain-containing protein